MVFNIQALVSFFCLQLLIFPLALLKISNVQTVCLQNRHYKRICMLKMHKTSCVSTYMNVISLIFLFWSYGKWIVLCRFRGLSLFLPTLRLQVSRTYDCSGLQLPQSLDCLHLLVCFAYRISHSAPPDLNLAVSQLLLDAIKRFLNLSLINLYSYFVIIFERFNSLFFTYAQRFA